MPTLSVAADHATVIELTVVLATWRLLGADGGVVSVAYAGLATASAAVRVAAKRHASATRRLRVACGSRVETAVTLCVIGCFAAHLQEFLNEKMSGLPGRARSGASANDARRKTARSGRVVFDGPRGPGHHQPDRRGIGTQRTGGDR